MNLLLSVIIPAYNEERYLPSTLAHLRAAVDGLREADASADVELIAVDNDSSDRTAEVAANLGCRVVHESEHNIARVRNAGARQARGDVFVDADTLVPPETLLLIAREIADPDCLGGAVDVLHTTSRQMLRWYPAVWRVIGRVTGMAQGATQFCRREDFFALGGYDERVFMGEDVEFFRSLKKRAKQSGRVAYITEIQVTPSPRRFDQWPIWQTLLWTNPAFIMVFRKTRRAWPGWYKQRSQ